MSREGLDIPNGVRGSGGEGLYRKFLGFGIDFFLMGYGYGYGWIG